MYVDLIGLKNAYNCYIHFTFVKVNNNPRMDVTTMQPTR